MVHFIIVGQRADIPDLSEVLDDPEAFARAVDKLADLYRLELWLDKAEGEWLVRKARIHGGARLVPTM